MKTVRHHDFACLCISDAAVFAMLAQIVTLLHPAPHVKRAVATVHNQVGSSLPATRLLASECILLAYPLSSICYVHDDASQSQTTLLTLASLDISSIPQ